MSRQNQAIMDFIDHYQMTDFAEHYPIDSISEAQVLLQPSQNAYPDYTINEIVEFAKSILNFAQILVTKRFDASQNEQWICETLFHDNTVTLQLAHIIINALGFADFLMGTAYSKTMKPKIDLAAQGWKSMALANPAVKIHDCPLCFCPMPHGSKQVAYNVCCGVQLCTGCVYGLSKTRTDGTCPYCRKPVFKNELEFMEQLQNRVRHDDPTALKELGSHYHAGTLGLKKDTKEAIKYWKKSTELGDPESWYNIAAHYLGQDKNTHRGHYYLEKAVIGGHLHSMFILGRVYEEMKEYPTSMQYLSSAAKHGHEESMSKLRVGYKKKLITKEKLFSIIRQHHESVQLRKTPNREKVKYLHLDQAQLSWGERRPMLSKEMDHIINVILGDQLSRLWTKLIAFGICTVHELLRVPKRCDAGELNIFIQPIREALATAAEWVTRNPTADIINNFNKDGYEKLHKEMESVGFKPASNY